MAITNKQFSKSIQDHLHRHIIDEWNLEIEENNCAFQFGYTFNKAQYATTNGSCIKSAIIRNFQKARFEALKSCIPGIRKKGGMKWARKIAPIGYGFIDYQGSRKFGFLNRGIHIHGVTIIRPEYQTTFIEYYNQFRDGNENYIFLEKLKSNSDLAHVAGYGSKGIVDNFGLKSIGDDDWFCFS